MAPARNSTDSSLHIAAASLFDQYAIVCTDRHKKFHINAIVRLVLGPAAERAEMSVLLVGHC
jgi:hypothetical protein